MSYQPLPGPGWYQDPDNAGLERYWDGATWTPHRRYAAPVALPSRTPPNRSLVFVAIVSVIAALAAALLTAVTYIGRQVEPLSSASESALSAPPIAISDDILVIEDRPPGGVVTQNPAGPSILKTLDGAVNPSAPYASFLTSYLKHLDRYWSAEFQAAYGREFEPITNGVRYWRTGTKIDENVTCGYDVSEIVLQNAFYASCGEDEDLNDVIVYDDEQLFTEYNNDYGPLALGLVLAHEWGHAVQARTGEELTTLLAELQADCYAGAWLLDLRQDPLWDEVTGKGSYVPGAVESFVTEYGFWEASNVSSAEDPQAHGSAFDRVGSLLDGMRNGAAKCRTYATAPPSVVMPASDYDVAYAGDEDAPAEEIARVLKDVMVPYWSSLAAGQQMPARSYESEVIQACVFPAADYVFTYCSSQNLVLLDPSYESYFKEDQTGDLGFLTMVALAWSDAYKVKTGALGHRACYVGSWVRSLYDGKEASVQLSTGDVDEAARAMLWSDERSAVANGTYATTHLEEFRKGFLESC